MGLSGDRKLPLITLRGPHFQEEKTLFSKKLWQSIDEFPTQRRSDLLSWTIKEEESQRGRDVCPLLIVGNPRGSM